jgi:hypothetical protein
MQYMLRAAASGLVPGTVLVVEQDQARLAVPGRDGRAFDARVADLPHRAWFGFASGRSAASLQ